MAERIVVGLSGGVDSSVAAAILVEQGFDVVGITLRVWPWQPSQDAARRFGSCCSPATVDDARQVARRLGIPYYLLNSEAEFDRTVISDFAREYEAGRTPVPCTVCNRDVKFGSLLARARAWDAAAVATGHYARITRDPATKRFLLWRGADAHKDQSDFLWPLSQAQLGAARFPVGDLTKAEVRERARALGLVTADKPESQEICFIPDNDYRGFLRRRIPQAFRPGPIVDGRGRMLGEHAGLVEVDILVAEKVNWISIERLDGPLDVLAQIRHRHTPARAIIRPADRGVEVRFEAPQWAPAPGQSVVFYQ